MSSVSSIFQAPSTFYSRDSEHYINAQEHVKNAVFWTIGAVLSCMSVELKENNKGIMVTVSTFHVLLSLFATILLSKGIRECRVILVVPWIVFTIYMLNQIQFKDIFFLYYSIIGIKMYNVLPWLALLAYTLAIVIRVQLMVSVCYLAIRQWCFNVLCKDLEKERSQ